MVAQARNLGKSLSESDLETTVDVSADPGEDDTFREGGVRGWSTLLGAALVQFATFGYTNSFGVYQGFSNLYVLPRSPLTDDLLDFYVREYLTNYTPGTIGWIGGVQIFIVFTSGFLTGRAFDRGYFHHLMIGSSLLHVFSFFMLSLSHENKYYQVFLSQGIGAGLAAGLAFVPSMGVASHYFRRQLPFAMGIVTAGTALGAILHPIMLNFLFQGRIGFHNGIRISTAMNAVLLLIANLVMRPRKLAEKTQASIPLTQLLRDPAYLTAVLGVIIGMIGLNFPTFYLQLYAVTLGISDTLAFYCLSIMSAASFFGRIIPSLLAPKFGIFNLNIIFTISMGIMIYALLAVKSVAGVIAFAIVYGFMGGGAVAFTPPMIASLANDPSEIGSRIGVAFSFTGIIGLVATPISGALLTSQYHWWRPILFTGTATIASGSLFAVSRFFLARTRGTQII